MTCYKMMKDMYKKEYSELLRYILWYFMYHRIKSSRCRMITLKS